MAQQADGKADEGLSEATRKRIAMIRAERAAANLRALQRAAGAKPALPADFPFQPDMTSGLAALRRAAARETAALVGLIAFLLSCALLVGVLSLPTPLPV